MKKLLFFLFWFLIILLGPITVIKTSIDLNIAHKLVFDVNILQRIVGLMAFEMVFFQIVLGSFMDRWTEKLGGWIYKFHTKFEGPLTYVLVFAHPVFFVLFNYNVTHKLDPFYVFTDFCVLCNTSRDLYLTLGRIAFWLVTIAVLAAEFRVWSKFRKYWRKFHILNYLVFFIITIHSFFLGTDSYHKPFVYFYYFAVPIVVVITIYKIYKFLKENLRLEFRIK